MLAHYGDRLDCKALAEDVDLIIDVQNKGNVEKIASHTALVVSSNEELAIDNCHDLTTLRSLSPKSKLCVADQEDLFLTLNKNLSKNSVELRRATLRALVQLFETEDYLVGEEATVD